MMQTRRAGEYSATPRVACSNSTERKGQAESGSSAEEGCLLALTCWVGGRSDG